MLKGHFQMCVALFPAESNHDRDQYHSKAEITHSCLQKNWPLYSSAVLEMSEQPSYTSSPPHRMLLSSCWARWRKDSVSAGCTNTTLKATRLAHTRRPSLFRLLRRH